MKIALFLMGLAVLPSFTTVFSGDPSKTIILIPYQPMMHLSDADADIAEHSKINVRQVRTLMRNALTENLVQHLREGFYVRMLTEAGTAKEKDDLNNFYDSENFYLSSRDTNARTSASASADSENPYFGIFKKSSHPDYASSYMNVALSKPVLFKELSASYKAGYFLVLTQFEIKTHYNECIDIPNRVFRREFLVHFSVFDAGGKQTGGTAVSVDAGSDANNINKITGDVFPGLIEKVCAHVAAVTP